ncbi:phosphatase PAP2 family protein [soil metagenome]
MRRLLLSAAVGCLLMPAAAAAQDRSVRSDLGNVLDDVWYVVSAPGHATSADFQTAGLIAGGFGVLLLLVDEPLQQWLRDNPNSLVVQAFSPFREHSPVSLIGRTRQFLLPLSAALYGAGLAFDSGDLRDAGIGCAATNLTTTLTRSLTSLLIGRLRPGSNGGAFVFEPLAFGDWEMRSFPGGHASNVMSCASFFNNRFDLGLAGPAVYGLAAGVGAARIVDEAHWASDSFVGMAYGYSVGKAMAARYSNREAERTMQPQLTLGWRIAF